MPKINNEFKYKYMLLKKKKFTEGTSDSKFRYYLKEKKDVKKFIKLIYIYRK